MALVGADGNPVAAPAQLIDVNQLKTAFGNPKNFGFWCSTFHCTYLV